MMRLHKTVDGSTAGPHPSIKTCVRSLLDFIYYLFKDMTFRYCSFSVDSFVGLPILLLSSTSPVSSVVFKDTLHIMQGFAKFMAGRILTLISELRFKSEL